MAFALTLYMLAALYEVHVERPYVQVAARALRGAAITDGVAVVARGVLGVAVLYLS